jgi:uncharacterized protein
MTTTPMPAVEFVDAHCHFGDDFEPLLEGTFGLDNLVAEWDRYGVSRGIISVILAGQMERANDQALEATKRYPGRVYAYAYLDPRNPAAAVRELDRCAEHADAFRGVKMHPCEDAWYPFHEPYFPVYQRIAELGLPILMHSGTPPYSNPLAIGAVAGSFPDIPFILGHFGLADALWECDPAASGAPNIYADPSLNGTIPPIKSWIAKHGSRRMLFGSDYPFGDVGLEQAKVSKLAEHDGPGSLDATALAQIAGENAVRIFRLPDRGGES